MKKSILASIMVIGLIGAFASSSTLALFSDTEASQGNEFVTGALDLKLDWNESYNGEHIEAQSLTDNPGPIFDFEDIKPGDHGEATVSVHIEDNPGWVWMRAKVTADEEIEITEPERAMGDTDPDGELNDELKFTIWRDDGDNIHQSDEEVIAEGHLRDIQSDLREGILLGEFDASQTHYIGVKWELPREVGNRVQKDRIDMDFEFYTEQRRHNDNPENPWTGEPHEPPQEPVNTDDILLTAICTDSEDDLAKFRVRNDNNQAVTVQYDVYQQSSMSNLTVAANSEEFIEVNAANDQATVRLFYNGSQIDVKANNPSFCDLGEPNEPEPVSMNPRFTGCSAVIAYSDHEPDSFQVVVDSNGTVQTQNVSTADADEVFQPNHPQFGSGESGLIGYKYNYDKTVGLIGEESFINPNYNLEQRSCSNSTGIANGSSFDWSSVIDNGYEEKVITATQGDTTVEITPLEGNQTVEELYDYRLPDRFNNEADNNATNGATYPGSGPYYQSVGTQSLQQQETSIMFLYDGPNGLSLVVVHDMAGGDGGSATWQITGLDNSGEWVVKDDLYLRSNGQKAGSNYDDWDVDSEPQTINWTWGAGGTDGGAFRGLGNDFSFTIDPAFNEESALYNQFYNGDIDDWQVLSGSMSNPDRTSLALDQNVTVEAN
ncbi:SipW-dependent-type signal peptide-containing protein [Candidatus Nanohalovita haloferacivicina]|uniref:SipW-dependent-type signal peptide-containing protein n=1 Tax=Candidatus Nanohalovita haloferacivicina TaxID=2978046 RepID=UPI00325FB321|nr:hypothetical protein HBNXNv_0744 [Candidatus Nanohalobia archaeon BNXNv]